MRRSLDLQCQIVSLTEARGLKSEVRGLMPPVAFNGSL